MVRKKAQHEHQVQPHLKGGDGAVEIVRTACAGEYQSGLQLIGRLILPPGSSLGYHEHQGEEEIIHVLKGSARYNDDGVEIMLSEGDSCVCLSGHGHSIACADKTQPLEIYAVVNKL